MKSILSGLGIYLPHLQKPTFTHPSTVRGKMEGPMPFKTQIITHMLAEREHDEISKIHAINPVDESDAFKELCEACRRFASRRFRAVRARANCTLPERGDVKTVRQLIQFGGVNLNAMDKFDYPPLTLVSPNTAIVKPPHPTSSCPIQIAQGWELRQVYVGITMSFNCCLSLVHCVSGIRFKGRGASKMYL